MIVNFVFLKIFAFLNEISFSKKILHNTFILGKDKAKTKINEYLQLFDLNDFFSFYPIN